MKIMSKVLFMLFSLWSINLTAQRSLVNFNSGWKHGAGSEASVTTSTFDDSAWESVDLPHTWNGLDGQDGGDDYFRGEKWYRKAFSASNAWIGKKVFIRFGAANMETTVFLNGQNVGKHVGGYAAFIFDITDFLKLGESNTLAVKVSNSATIDAAPLSGDFTMFGGITRKVELIITDPIFISPLDYASSGVYITPHDISSASASAQVDVLVSNHSDLSAAIEITAVVKDKEGKSVTSASSNVTLVDAMTETQTLELTVNNPKMWNGRIDPYLYKVEVSLKVNNVLKDQVIQPLGFRTYSVDANTGFTLNGANYELHGVCHHEDRPNIGRAISDENRKEDLDILTEMGCTYLRLTHYQHGAYTYDYCDSIGMVLSTEVPLVNKISSSTFFAENAKSQLLELIKQNYNHPSVMFWGMFNEINFHAGPNPAPLIGELHELTHQTDPTRLTTGAAQNDEADTHWLLDVMGWNKYLGWYEQSYNDYPSWTNWLRSRHPSTKISMSEYGVGASINHHEQDPPRPDPGGRFHPEEYQNIFHEAYWQVIESKLYMWSSAIWVGFDFASDWRNEGENVGINDKGMVTRDRKVKKDAFYYYKANWTDEPFAYITSRRHVKRYSPETDIKVYSNCDYVLAELNGTSLGISKSDNHIYSWDNVSLAHGENLLRIQGVSSNGAIVYDSCIWNYRQRLDTLLPGEVKINFQTPTSNTPVGYLADDGDIYGERGNGYNYGWNFDNAANSRERTFTSDTLFNTFNHFQKAVTEAFWEIEVENGYYQVSIGCGDPDFVDSNHKLLVEDLVIIEGKNTNSSMIRATDTVQVLDGRLTVKPANGAANAKINVIHITKVNDPITVEPVDTTSQVLNVHGKNDIRVIVDQNTKSLFIKAGGHSTIKTVEVNNLLGQQVYIKEISGIEDLWEVAGLDPGIYVVRVLTHDSFIKTVKVLIMY